MPRLLLLGMLLLLPGCVSDRDWLLISDSFYSRAQVDAINAEAQCKALARNLVQISRCETRR
jgi:hypothetical protein